MAKRKDSAEKTRLRAVQDLFEDLARMQSQVLRLEKRVDGWLDVLDVQADPEAIRLLVSASNALLAAHNELRAARLHFGGKSS